MDLTETIKMLGGKSAVSAVSKRVGLDEATTAKAIDALMPSIQSGLQKNVERDGGGKALVDALDRGDHAKYLDDPEALGRDESVAEGNGILGHVLGSKDASRAIAGQVAQSLGIDEEITKQVLPMVASLAMGGLSKQKSQAEQQGGGGDLLGQLGGLLGGGGGGGLADLF